MQFVILYISVVSPFLPKELFINFKISLQEGFSVTHVFLTSVRVFLLFGITVENWSAYQKDWQTS